MNLNSALFSSVLTLLCLCNLSDQASLKDDLTLTYKQKRILDKVCTHITKNMSN